MTDRPEPRPLVVVGNPLRVRRAAGSFGLMDRPRDPHDEYETPQMAVDMLLAHESFAGGIWDSSCGRGKLIRALRHHYGDSKVLTGSDLYPYPYEQDEVLMFGFDFLRETRMMRQSQNIVINPPFKESEAHIRHGLALLPDRGKLAALLRFTWITAQRRADLLAFIRKVIICGRLKMLPPGVPDQGHGGTVDFAWFIFDSPCNVVMSPQQTHGAINIVRA